MENDLDFYSVDAELRKEQEFAETERPEEPEPDVSATVADEITERATAASIKYAKRHPEATIPEISAFYSGYQAALIDSI